MVMQTVRLGSLPNILRYDDADYDAAIETTAPIKAGTPVDINDVLRLEDLPTIASMVLSDAVITDHAIVRGDGGARGVQDSAVILSDAGQIGINTVPSYALHVIEADSPTVFLQDSTTPCQVFLQAADTIGRVGTVSNHDFRIQTNSTDRIFVENDGRVGIGIAATAVLHLKAGTAAAGTGQIKLEASTLLATPEIGVMEFADSRFYITNVAHQRAIDRTSDVVVTTVTVENTVVETTIWTATMDADSLAAGNMFEFHADGIVSNGGPTAADRVTLRIKVGGVTKATISPVAGNLTNDMWHIDANACQRTIGAGGQRAMHLHLVIGTTEEHVIGVVPVDTTANMDITFTVEWASADAANIFNLYQAFMQYKN